MTNGNTRRRAPAMQSVTRDVAPLGLTSGRIMIARTVALSILIGLSSLIAFSSLMTGSSEVLAQAPAPPAARRNPGQGTRAGTSAAAKVQEITLPPLAPDATTPGERFSAHAKQLLRTVTSSFDLNGAPAYPATTPAKTLEDADFVLRLTQSKDDHLREAAVLSTLLYAIHPEGEGERLLKAAEQVTDSIDLAKAFDDLLKSKSNEQRDSAFRELGGKLSDITFTRTFQQENRRRYRSYLAGYLSAAARERAIRYARQAGVGQKPRTAPIRVAVEHVPNDRTYLRIRNQTQQPQRHVLIVTRGISDPDHVRYRVKGARVQGEVGKWFGIIPDDAQAEMPSLIRLWEWSQLVEVGTVLYLAELPATADIRVEFCTNERLEMTEDIRVSFWSDEVYYEDIRPSNLASVLQKVRPADEVRRARGLVERERETIKRTEDLQGGLAQFALDLAKERLSSGDMPRAKALLREAIRNAPESPAGREAKSLLDNPDLANAVKRSGNSDAAGGMRKDSGVSPAVTAQRNKQAMQLLNAAKQALAAKNHALARVYLKQVMSVAPDSPAARQARLLMRNLDR